MKMKIKRILFLITLVCVFTLGLAACGSADKEKGENSGDEWAGAPAGGAYEKLTAEEAKKIMDGDSDAIILDVRTAEEYAEVHIPNARLLPNEEITDEPPEGLPLSSTILVYCRSGNRSKQAADKLIAMGYENVKDFGGIIDWPYETVKGTGNEEGGTGQDDKGGGTKDASGTEGQGGDEESDAVLTGEFKGFQGVDINGNTVLAEDIFSKADLTVVNLWGTFCGPCIREMPDLAELSAEYEGKGVQFVGVPVDVTTEETLANALKIIEASDVEYLNLLPTKELYDIYLKNVKVVPETLFVDKTGTIITSVKSSRSKEKWEKLIDEIYEQVKA